MKGARHVISLVLEAGRPLQKSAGVRGLAAGLVAAAVLGMAGLVGAAQDGAPAAPPALTEVQRLRLQTVVQRIEIAILKAQAVQREFDQAVAERDALIRGLAVDGWTFDPQTMTYRANPPAAGGGK